MRNRLFALCLLAIPSLFAGGKPLTCGVAIIGVGFGGLHTAHRLGPTLND